MAAGVHRARQTVAVLEADPIERLAAPESLALIDEVQAGEQTADRP